MAIFTSARFFFAMGIAIFLALFFAPDEFVTILVQSFYFTVLLVNIAVDVAVILLFAVVFIFAGLIATVLPFISNEAPNTVLAYQSLALQGVDAYFMGWYKWIRDVADIFENLLGVTISYLPGQTWDQGAQVIGSDIVVIVEKTVSGVKETIEDFLENLGVD